MLKYGNNSSFGLCQYGFSHRSKLERAVCDMIYLRERAGEIKHLRHEVTHPMTLANIKYIADFECIDLKTGETLVIEAKGYETPEWRLKRRLWQYYGPSPLEVWVGHYTRPSLKEIIIPSKKSIDSDDVPHEDHKHD